MRHSVVTSVSTLVLLALATFGRPSVAAAQSTHDTQVWWQTLATVKVSPDWLVHLEAQPRWSEDASELNQVIVRSALGRKLSDSVSVWGGYAWVPRTLGPGTRHEQRGWQQLSAAFPETVGSWTPSIRIRLEQRFLDGWEDSSHRLRIMGRAVRPLTADKTWSIATWNELMVNFDETGGGPAQGIDQNRFFAGVLRKISPKASVETGYLWQTQNPPGLTTPRAHAHTAFVWLNLIL